MILAVSMLTQNTSDCSESYETQLYRKVSTRLIPLLLVCYVISYLDRVNIGFAKLAMTSDLGFSDAVYGLGAGIFFIGYFLFEVPSNVIMHRVGARRWIARIMFTWGVLSAANAFVTTATQFYTIRFLLGVAEAGFFPGVLLYLAYWFPTHRLGRATALFMTAVPLTGIVGSPISGWILETTGQSGGLKNWQHLFLIEAAPAIIASVVVLCVLSNGIRDAGWLTTQEKDHLQRNIDEEQKTKPTHSLLASFRSPEIWVFGSIYFSFVIGLYGISFWLPTIIRATGVSHPGTIGLLTAVPYILAAAVMVPVSRRSDRHRERRWHIAASAIGGSIGLWASIFVTHNPLLAVLAMSVATTGIITALPLFWSLPNARLTGVAAAAGLAVINSIGNLAGFVSPYLVGLLSTATHDTRAGVAMMACSMLVGAALTLSLPAERRHSETSESR